MISALYHHPETSRTETCLMRRVQLAMSWAHVMCYARYRRFNGGTLARLLNSFLAKNHRTDLLDVYSTHVIECACDLSQCLLSLITDSSGKDHWKFMVEQSAVLVGGGNAFHRHKCDMLHSSCSVRLNNLIGFLHAYRSVYLHLPWPLHILFHHIWHVIVLTHV